MITKIKKRDLTVVGFNKEKITSAIFKSVKAVGGHDKKKAEELAGKVVELLEKKYSTEVPTVEDVQDVVEKVLIEEGHAKTAKAYILYRQERTKIREEQKKILRGRTTKLPYTLNALQVVAKRYLVRDEEGELAESPEEMLERVADALSKVEFLYGKSEEEVKKFYKEFLEITKSFEFTAAGRTIANAGGPTRVVSNCIVLHIEDSMDSIFQTLKEAALLQQAGSGLGFPLHLMRPAGLFTVRSRGQASGPISFLQVYNQAFGVIKQQNRHGANMAVMRVDHPDILEFVHCKDREGDLRNFNVSVGLTNEFMQKVKDNDPSPWMCTWKGKKMKPRRVKRDQNFSISDMVEETMTAKQLFEEIISSAWLTGEPGCVFLDKVNETNPVPGLGRIEACNPCGEQFLHDGDVCNLGSINLEKFVKTVDDKPQVDFERLKYVTKIATRILDNVVDITDFPVEKVNKRFRENRRIGLGIMGFADMLYQLGVGYNTQKGFETAEMVMKCINDSSHEMSQQLAEEKGVFPNWELSIYKEKGIKMRNAALTNIAPTGTISMMFDVSGGVEPYFALAYYYKGILGGDTQLSYVNKWLKKALVERGIYSEELMGKIIKEGTLQNLDEIPEDMKRTFVTSMDISSEQHTRMQAAFQKYCDNAISKTINFPNSATKEDVLQGYIFAWQLGCKGCTVYRDGSRELQVLNLEKTKDQKEEKKSKAAASPVAKVKPQAVELEEQEVGTAPQIEEAPILAAEFKTKHEIIRDGICPECSDKIIIGEGCLTCVSCGFSVCTI